MLLMLLLCAASPRPLQAADVAFTGVLPNGALYHAPVVSMREARFSNLVRQQTDYSCGAAALATILRYAYHLDADETTVIEGMLSLADLARNTDCDTEAAEALCEISKNIRRV